jgi:hypothetical protein
MIRHQEAIMVKRLLIGLLITAMSLGGAAAAASDNYFPRNLYDARFCAGLKTEFRSENASRLDCTSATNAIVVEYFDYWPEAIGQSLALATKTGLKPGIVLVCRNDHQHCTNAASAVEATFARMNTPLTLWDCGLTDTSLAECNKLE